VEINRKETNLSKQSRVQHAGELLMTGFLQGTSQRNQWQQALTGATREPVTFATWAMATPLVSIK
jgi:hypothetical protein